ncbi:ATP-binding protein [Blautia sp. HCP3S3_G3]|uniref:ATP-binding protein n=1 Tax=Blautia sp. HCP3S3_G3 TaxID=3438913 RepID=UPI003F8BBFA5
MTERKQSMKEGKSLEWKEYVTNTFLKTVSAFANYDGGRILFGIDDNGEVKGLDDPKQACLDIENKINDSIVPQPDYTLCVREDEKTVCLKVKAGISKPYLYKSKAYKRNDTSTIEVDAMEFKRLVLEGKNLNFEELPSGMQQLTFENLAEKMENVLGIEKFDMDVLRTLNLYSDRFGYNNAAAVFADKNVFPGIDIAKFGENVNIIQKRATYSHMSVLSAYENALNIYRDYYQYEKITGSLREKVERIPEAAFREAIANALIHRLWDVEANVKISMFDDRIEIVSPGGLPTGISQQEYLSGKISVLRNPIMANVFYRLKIVEIFGPGILRILYLYEKSIRKPVFEISENTIKVILPVIENTPDMTKDEKAVYQLLSKNRLKSISEISASSDFGKTKVTSILKALAKRGIVTIEGKGRGTKYRL